MRCASIDVLNFNLQCHTVNDVTLQEGRGGKVYHQVHMVGKEGMREEETKIGRTSALEKTTKQFNIQPIPIGVKR